MRFQQFDSTVPASYVQHMVEPSLEESPLANRIRLLNESAARENEVISQRRLEVQQRAAALKSQGSLRSFRRTKDARPKQLSAPDRIKALPSRSEEDKLWDRVLSQNTPEGVYDYQQEVDNESLQADMEAYAQHFQNCADTTPEIDVWADALKGEVTSFGAFPYKHQKGEKISYMIRLGTLEVWGVDLERCMVEYDIDIGDRIALKRIGKVPVQVMQNVIDELGNVIGEEPVTVDRVSWIAKRL
ncbi:hypothetical protein BLL42_27075 (plasmid) [Pseudomonas frederiksbergensis]|uniref:Uncharacterized protein n=1 Tax=Pseudomonas frederiksbergensis TaxID=104087 RepID=A0A1J0EUD3_9PSED|nr:hypothetical protein [Pseudomonas frederiksbergensis]APC19404.1 hypothetical protein BLL42_27075 [Pseudomonas frederiksbergensis]